MNHIIINKNILSCYEDDNIVISNNKITFKKNGDYTLEYLDSDCIQLEIEVIDNVMVKLFVFGINQKLKINNWYRLGEYSNLLLFKFYYNDMVDEVLKIDLNGKFSKFSYAFSSISKGEEEYHIIVNHNNCCVSSNISNQCIGMDDSKIKIQIDSVLEKGNIDCVMDQTSRILTLGDVDAMVIPNMFIDEDSVEARHGSVIGGFSDDEVFYLMSRGLPEDETITLLIRGFIFSNLVVDMEKRAKIFQVLQDLRR